MLGMAEHVTFFAAEGVDTLYNTQPSREEISAPFLRDSRVCFIRKYF